VHQCFLRPLRCPCLTPAYLKVALLHPNPPKAPRVGNFIACGAFPPSPHICLSLGNLKLFARLPALLVVLQVLMLKAVCYDSYFHHIPAITLCKPQWSKATNQAFLFIAHWHTEGRIASLFRHSILLHTDTLKTNMPALVRHSYLLHTDTLKTNMPALVRHSYLLHTDTLKTNMPALVRHSYLLHTDTLKAELPALPLF